MQNNPTVTNRYSDQELEEFKKLIEQKIESTQQQYDSLAEIVKNISEMSGDDGDYMDDSSNMQDLDMLNSMMGRHLKHIQDLENALIRIHNKRYGVCAVSGQLIDKRRLLAVLTTTKSIAAKTTNVNEKPKTPKRKTTSQKPQSFSRIIKRTGGTSAAQPKVEKDNFFDDEEEDDVLGLGLDETFDGDEL